MQEMHWSGSTQAIWPPTGIFLRDRIDAARPATAVAWEIVSLMNFGAWAAPQRNRPSLAKSTGRSFMCASRKKPSAFSGTRSSSDSSPRSARGTAGAARTSRSGSRTRSRPSDGSRDLQAQFPADVEQLRRLLGLVADEQHALFPRLAVGRLAEPVGPHVAVEDDDPGVRPAAFQLQGILHRRRAADAAAIRPLLVALLDALDHRHGGLLRQR